MWQMPPAGGCRRLTKRVLTFRPGAYHTRTLAADRGQTSTSDDSLHRSRYWVFAMSPSESTIHNRQPSMTIDRAKLRTGGHRALEAAMALALLLMAAATVSAPVARAGEPAPPADAASSAGAPASPPDPASRPSETTLDDALGEAADPLAGIERQIQSEEYLPAIRDLEQRIESIEAITHSYDPRLIRPLTLLGDAQAGLGQHEPALRQYQRALHLSRVNQGLNTPEQVEIVYREANTYKALGDYQQANDREEYAYHVLNRAHDPTDEDLLPGIYHLAEWYERTSNVFAARALYEQAVDIISAHGKLDTPEAIPALEGIATSYRMERFPPNYMMANLENPQASVLEANAMPQQISVNNFPEGEAALQRIVRIRQAQADEDPIGLARAVLELADWYTLFDKMRRAEPLYAHAWEIMAGVESFDVVGYFAEPELLYFPAPGNPEPPPADERGERTTGFVEVAFDVTNDGYVRGLQTVGSEPDGLMDFRVRKSLRVTRYRPVLVDGVPISKEAHTFRHEFPYYPERESEPHTAAAAAGG